MVRRPTLRRAGGLVRRVPVSRSPVQSGRPEAGQTPIPIFIGSASPRFGNYLGNNHDLLPQNGASRSAHDSPLAIQLNLRRMTCFNHTFQIGAYRRESCEAPSLAPGFYLLREFPGSATHGKSQAPETLPDRHARSYVAF